MKLKVLAVGYLLGALAYATWFNAMDNRYGVGDADRTYAPPLMAAVWPLAAPLSMAVVATGGGGRWTLPAQAIDARSDETA